jgi:hypothetical protein
VHLPVDSITRNLYQNPVNGHSTVVPIEPGAMHPNSGDDMPKVVCSILEHFRICVPFLFKLLNALQSSALQSSLSQY